MRRQATLATPLLLFVAICRQYTYGVRAWPRDLARSTQSRVAYRQRQAALCVHFLTALVQTTYAIPSKQLERLYYTHEHEELQEWKVVARAIGWC